MDRSKIVSVCSFSMFFFSANVCADYQGLVELGIKNTDWEVNDSPPVRKVRDSNQEKSFSGEYYFRPIDTDQYSHAFDSGVFSQLSSVQVTFTDWDYGESDMTQQETSVFIDLAFVPGFKLGVGLYRYLDEITGVFKEEDDGYNVRLTHYIHENMLLSFDYRNVTEEYRIDFSDEKIENRERYTLTYQTISDLSVEAPYTATISLYKDNEESGLAVEVGKYFTSNTKLAINTDIIAYFSGQSIRSYGLNLNHFFTSGVGVSAGYALRKSQIDYIDGRWSYDEQIIDLNLLARF